METNNMKKAFQLSQGKNSITDGGRLEKNKAKYHKYYVIKFSGLLEIHSKSYLGQVSALEFWDVYLKPIYLVVNYYEYEIIYRLLVEQIGKISQLYLYNYVSNKFQWSNAMQGLESPKILLEQIKRSKMFYLVKIKSNPLCFCLYPSSIFRNYIVNDWISGELGNFNFLLLVNIMGGRSL